MNPDRAVAVQCCTSDRPMPANTSPRELVRWEHPELALRGNGATQRTYRCPNCGLVVSVPKG